MKNNFKSNFIVAGDTHIRYTAPSFRKETFYNELLNKIEQINDLAEKYDATVICLGDFFNNYVEDYFEAIAFDLSSLTKNWYSIIGNHDCKSSNGDLRGTSFGVMVKSGLLNILEDTADFDAFHYYKKDLFEKQNTNKKIAFIHDYVMPKGTKENFEYKECNENQYDFVFCGHYHYPFDVQVGHTRYINPGSLMRLTVSELKLNRNPEVILYIGETQEIKHISLKVKPLIDIVEKQEESINKTFDSKFVDMLLSNNLVNNNGSDITNLLKQNKVENEVVEYVDKKLKEIV